MRRTQRLKRLEIAASFPFEIDPETGEEDGQWTSEFFFDECIKDCHWKHLKSFKLANIVVDHDDLHEFLIRHKSTLCIFRWEPFSHTSFAEIAKYLVRWRRMLSLKKAHILLFGKCRWEKSLQEDKPHHKALRRMVQDQLEKDSSTMDFGCCVIRSTAGSSSSSVTGLLDDIDIDV